MTNNHHRFEDELGASLRSEANHAPLGPTGGDIMRRLHQRKRRRTGLVAAALVLLVAGMSSFQAVTPDNQQNSVFYADAGEWSYVPMRGEYDDGYMMVHVEPGQTSYASAFERVTHGDWAKSNSERASKEKVNVNVGDVSHASFADVGTILDAVSESHVTASPSEGTAPSSNGGSKLAYPERSREQGSNAIGAGGGSGAVPTEGRAPAKSSNYVPHLDLGPVEDPSLNSEAIGKRATNSAQLRRMVGNTETLRQDLSLHPGLEGKAEQGSFGYLNAYDLARAQMDRIYNSKSGELWAKPVIASTGEVLQSAAPFSLEHTNVDVSISGYVASTTVTQSYYNHFDREIEAIYVFPLPTDAAVNDFTMSVGGRKIIGMIRKKAEARRIYEEARDMGYTAALLEQQRPNIFQQSLANIAPGENIDVDITFFNRLTYKNGEYEYTFPMVVAPRYAGHTPDYDSITPVVLPRGVRSGHDVSVNVFLDAGVPMHDSYSPTHQLESRELDSNCMQFRLSRQDEIPNRDFVLRYSVIGEKLQTGVVTHSSDLGGYVSLMFTPPSNPHEEDISPRELTFILDVSGSMNGAPMNMSKEIMMRTLDRMRPHDTFNIFYFAGRNAQLWELPQPNTPDNVQEAKTFLSNLRASGGTEMLAGLQRLFESQHDPNRLRMVMFLTDGKVGNENSILQHVRDNVRDSRFFCFGVGRNVNHYLVENIGKQGRGASSIVLTGRIDGDNAQQEAVNEFYGFIDAPVLTDITVDWDGLDVSDPNPGYIPDVFTGRAITLVARYHTAGSGVVRINARKGGVPVSYSVPVTLPAFQESNAALAPIWARAKIDDLGEEKLFATSDRINEIEEEVTQLALDFNLVSEKTSFVAVDDMTIVGSGRPMRVKVSVDRPAGSEESGDGE